MGARHNREHSDRGDNPYSIGHGYRLPGIFRTVMSYGNGCFCPRIPFFSADGYSFGGEVIGSPTENNARVVAYNAPRVSRFNN